MIEEVIQNKRNKLYVKWKGCDSSFNSWIDKNDLVWKWVNTFLNHMNHFAGDINIKVYLYNYATKPSIKNISHVDTPSCALKLNLASLKS